MTIKANLRTCASCEFIYKLEHSEGCPKCDFGSYGARSVYGDKAYRYAVTQEPWLEKQMDRFRSELYGEIRKYNLECEVKLLKTL